MPSTVEIQGHRGARGLKPENTLPSFEAAFDLGVTSVETDLHLTRDGIPILCHDARLGARLCRLAAGAAAATEPLIRELSLAELRSYRADRNPDPRRFPNQDCSVTPLAQAFAEARGIDPFTLPTLADLFAFAAAYVGEMGAHAGKTDAQRDAVRRLWFDLELKRVPYYEHFTSAGYNGPGAAALEDQTLAVIRDAGVLHRTRVRSFDHRCVRYVRDREPALEVAVLVAFTAPVAPEDLARAAGATLYCPDYEFLDEPAVRRLQSSDIRVLPWTVNRPEDWGRLLDWGVDGITTDFPDQLAVFLRAREVG